MVSSQKRSSQQRHEKGRGFKSPRASGIAIACAGGKFAACLDVPEEGD
jgi:hypothetical protein